MATDKEIKSFFDGTSKKPQVARINGKFAFNNLPEKTQAEIKTRLAEKDLTMAGGLAGELPGIKIDGKVVTKDNIHEFEK